MVGYLKSFLPILLIICGLVLISYNRFFADWKEILNQEAVYRFDQLIEHQKEDLIHWSKGQNSDNIFSKQVICNGRVEKWSDNRPFPKVNTKENIYFLDTVSGSYLYQTFQEEGGCSYVSVFRMVNKYPITNEYLEEGIDAYIHPAVQSIIASADGLRYKQLFYYSIQVSQNKVLDSLAALCLLIAFFYGYGLLASKHTYWFWAATFIAIAIWMVNLEFGIIADLIPYPLFNGIYYSSSFLSVCLGELLLTCFLLLYVVVLFNQHHKSAKSSRVSIFLTSIFSISLMCLVYYVGWDIMKNSQISLDIGETLELDLLRIVGWLSILILGLIYLNILFHLLHILRQGKHFIYCIVGSSLAFLLLLDDLSAIIPILIHLFLLFLFVKSSIITSGKSPQHTHLILIWWISVGLSTTLSYCLYKHYELDERNAKRKFANHLILKRDIFGEYYIHEALLNLEQIDLKDTFDLKEQVFQHIKEKFSNPYFQGYELTLTQTASLAIDFVPTEYANISFVDEDDFVGYLCNLPDKWSAYILLLRFKKHTPLAVFPSLLTDDKYYNLEESYDYAIIENNKVAYQKSKFGYSLKLSLTDLKDEQLYNDGIVKEDKHYLGVRMAKGNVLLIVSETYAFKDLISNFCFLLLLFIVLFNACFFVKGFIRRKQKPLGFALKLQFYMAFVLVIPLLVTGIALLSLLYNSYKNEINRNYLKKSLYISENLSDIDPDSQIVPLKNKLSEMSGFVKADISYYGHSGHLVASSQPNIFSFGLQSARINPIVFDYLVEKKNLSVITDETIGTLEYRVCYAIIEGENDAVAGFIAMPFFNSKNHFKRQQIEVFGSIISIFGLIVTLYIMFGNLVLANLLLPLHMVAEKMRAITLQEENEPIQYDAEDDIGSLVKDYNQMLVKLETSKKALAKSQKEQVWKQIAKQVAHEIKNPLTPMQLKIQQLLRNKTKNNKEEKILHSLLEQISTLSQIATSFSAFADMPVPENDIFDLSVLMHDAVHFHRSDSILIKDYIQPNILVYADKNIFRRILNNLILNAIQSVHNRKVPNLEIKLTTNKDKAILSVKDNGKGINKQLKDKIFLYQFSTKFEGSGIGLALAKKGIENMDGNIWFESEYRKGTTFYISLPFVHP